VWLARTGDPNDPACVIKKILPHLSSDTLSLERFLDETRVTLHLDHPNIARVLEVGEEDGQCYLAMEYIAGKTLGRISARLRERKESLPLALALHIGVQVCDALGYAHQKADPSGRPLNVVTATSARRTSSCRTAER